VLLPWSIWATIEKLRICSVLIRTYRFPVKMKLHIIYKLTAKSNAVVVLLENV
jgi:hypothetical protein